MAATTERSGRLALTISGLAVVVAAIGDGVLRATPWGLNFTVWAGSLLAAICLLAGLRGRALQPDARLLLAPALFFALALAWRDSPTLKLANVLALTLVLAMSALTLDDLGIRVAGLADYAFSVLRLVFGGALGVVLLAVNEVEWSGGPHVRWYRPALAIVRGMLIALPVLLLFGGLFTAADAVFERLARDLFAWDLSAIADHGLVISLLAWGVAGILYALFFGRPTPAHTESSVRPFSLGFVEIALLLGTLNLLFLAFVLIQVRYLFGGDDLVLTTLGLTYSEYARRGFFELVWVSALLLPLLLLTDWITPRRTVVESRALVVLMIGLVTMMLVIMASAVRRMVLYQEVFGLTELRVYPTFFMAWLALVYGWFVLTVMRNGRTRFASGAAVAGLVVIAALDVLNPDALIVRVNAGRPDVATRFDASYAVSLSADAVPALVEVLDRLGPEQRATIAERLNASWAAPAEPDWRTWSLARDQARQAVASRAAELATIAPRAASEKAQANRPERSSGASLPRRTSDREAGRPRTISSGNPGKARARRRPSSGSPRSRPSRAA